MLRLLTFGGLALLDGETPVAGAASQRSRLALLALLASGGTSGITRDKLLAFLWPDSDTDRARHALKQAVYALRRDLGAEQAVVGTAALSLDPSVLSSDVRDFQDALARGDDVAAVSVYAGPFLDGFHLKASAEFDRWCDEERARHARAYGDALERLAVAADRTGDYASAIRWWSRRAASDPLSGRVALALMRAHAASGDVTGAIQHARVHETVVRQELESRPDAAVLDFAERLRRGDVPAPRVAPPASIAPSASSPPPATPDARAGGPRLRRTMATLAAVAAAVAAIFAGAVPLIPSSTRSMASVMLARRSAPLSPRRIVVAPLENRTGDTTLSAVGELAADWIARSLLESNFEVVDSRTSAIAARVVAGLPRLLRGGDPALALARETGAGMVVTGRYYRQRDSLQLEATISDVAQGTLVRAVGPLRGPAVAAPSLVGALAMRVTAALAASTDSTAGGSTAALATPPSLEAFEHTSRAWESFFTRPADTATVFAELARAAAADTSYFAPRLMHAYVLDVKGLWPQLAAVTAELQPRRARMDRIERAALDLFEADLRGDLLGRIRASHELMRLSPGSPDMALLVAISNAYVHRFAEASAVLAAADPNRGINLVSPMYWAWRSAVAHGLGRADDEREASEQTARRFPSSESAQYALARSFASSHRAGELRELLGRAGLQSPSPSVESRMLAMFAARELRVHGAPEDAAALFERLAALHPPPAGAPRSDRHQHALALYEARRLADARALYSALAADDSLDLQALGRLGVIALRMGDTTEARRVERRLVGWRDPYAYGEPLKWRAQQAAVRGDAARAVSLLRAAFAQGYRAMDTGVVSLHEEGDFLPVRADPAFHALMRPRDGPLELP